MSILFLFGEILNINSELQFFLSRIFRRNLFLQNKFHLKFHPIESLLSIHLTDFFSELLLR